MNRDLIVARAEKYAAAGKLEAAIREYERLLDGTSADVVTLNRIGDLQVRLGRTGDAVAVFRKLAEHYARDGFHLKAIAILKKVNRLVPADLTVCSALADLYRRQRLTAEARAQYAVVADAYLHREDHEQALVALERSFELAPTDAATGIRVAALLAKTGRVAASEDVYRRLLHHFVGAAAAADIIRVALSALNHHPRGLQVVNSTAEALISRRQLPVAVALLQDACDREEAEAQTFALLGRAYIASGEIERAREFLQQAMIRFPGDATLRRNAAGLALISTEVEGADSEPSAVAAPELPQKQELQAADLPKNDVDELLNESDVYASYGLVIPAAAALEQVLAMRPEHAPALERLVRVALLDGRREDAVREASRLLAVLEKGGARDESARVQEDLRSKGLLDSVLAIAAVPELLRDPLAEAPPAAAPPPEDLEFDIVVELDHLPAEADAVAGLAAAETPLEESVEEPPDLAAAPPPQEEDAELARKIEGVQRLIARRKITRATKLLEELLVEHPDQPELMRIRDGLRTRKSASRRRTRPGEPLASLLQEDDRSNLEVN
jgi:tetratricopeptide (TPR) repeat protein